MEKVKLFSGIEAYLKIVNERTNGQHKEIKQIINGKQVARFHELTKDFIEGKINDRVSAGISMKNLITDGDRDLEIEKSNAKTLKETRVLPKSVEINNIITVFGDKVTISNLDPDNCFGIIIEDKKTAETFSSMFDELWERSEKI